MANEIYGRRPDKDGICVRCKADGHATHGPTYGRTFAYYAAAIKVRGRKAIPAKWLHHCAFHNCEVEAVAA